MILTKTLFIFLLIGLSYSEPPPKWSETYTVKGTLMIPYAELEEPFYAWYDSNKGRSRIDYYGGMDKTYQLSKTPINPYGTSLKIVPVTTEDELNAQTCLQVNGTEEESISIQTILPDLTNFKYMGDELIDGVSCEKWRYTNTIGQKINKYTMWLRMKRNIDNNEETSVPIPVRYEMRGFNSLLGSHYDHYYLDYEDYNPDDSISDDIFSIEDLKCASFPGPGIKHIYTFNPMKEFIHPATTAHIEHEFTRFKSKHNKHYSNKQEHNKRIEVFTQNMRIIHSMNRANLGYTLAVNHLTDRTDAELSALRGRRYSTDNNGASPFPYEKSYITRLSETIPKEFDWRLYGAVSPVKDQSVCGSCWSFGTIGAMEGAFFLHNGGHLVRLSQQALIDCSWGYGNNGCDGGEDFRSYQWIMKHGGIPTEDEYGGYLGQDGYCHANNVSLVAPIKGFVNVTTNDPNALKLAIFKHGPISVAIDASKKTFSFYSHGVYYEPKCKNNLDGLDHAVLAVGYGTMGGQDFWLVKNSWSNYWGNDGYILMSAKDNNCGVQTTPTYVVM